jgi:hypothetical protein
MGALKTAMTVQAIVTLIYGIPTLLAPDWWTTVTQQPPLPESYILRAVGISFVILAWLEFRIITDLERHRGLAVIYGWTSALFFVTIVAQALWRGFNGAHWYWWGNGIISGALATAVLTTNQKAQSELNRSV